MSSRLFVVRLQKLRYLGLPTRVVNTLCDASYIRTGIHEGRSMQIESSFTFELLFLLWLFLHSDLRKYSWWILSFCSKVASKQFVQRKGRPSLKGHQSLYFNAKCLWSNRSRCDYDRDTLLCCQNFTVSNVRGPSDKFAAMGNWPNPPNRVCNNWLVLLFIGFKPSTAHIWVFYFQNK